MWPSANSQMAHFVIMGNPPSQGNPRTTLFQAAQSALGLPAASFVSYADLLAGRADLEEVVTSASIVRIDSPGRDFAVEKAILMLGAEQPDPEGTAYQRLSRREITALPFEKGRLLPSRQWYLGFCALLRQIDSRLQGCQLMNTPDDIATMFDKRHCHALLEQAGVSVPRALEPISCYDDLIARMRTRGCYRVFLKLAHGSSASGVVAYRINGNHYQAMTTVEMVTAQDGIRLYNSRRIRLIEDPGQIRDLINALCRQRVHVEYWLPKADHQGRAFDLRVLVIAGQVRHIVVRLSQTPMTNLHLLNARADVGPLLDRLNRTDWQQTCRRAACQFNSLYAGLDVMFTPDCGHHAVLEVNAFGDLLPGILDNGQDTFTAEIQAVFRRVQA